MSQAVIVLAAGQSSRMGDRHKLLELVDGVPMVRHAVLTALASMADEVVVVTGHRHEAIAAALDGLPVTLVHNPDFAQGMATSLRVGVKTVAPKTISALIHLADMPRISRVVINTVLRTGSALGSAALVVPCRAGRRGNPVLIGRDWFDELAKLEGDQGARSVFQKHADRLTEVEIDDDAIFFDVDTPEALAAITVLSTG